MNLIDQIAEWLRTYLEMVGAKGYVVGLSGGVDSAVAAALAVKGVGRERVGALIMPKTLYGEDHKLGEMVAEWLGITDYMIWLSPIHQEFRNQSIMEPGQVANGNLYARLRMCALYLHANEHGYLVLGTGNKSELSVGYLTKFGDGGVDILPLGDVYKTEVWEMARLLGVPQEIIDRTPTAGLWEGQTDEGELGMTYQELDTILQLLVKGPPDVLSEQQLKVAQMMERAVHKLETPPIFQREGV